MRNSMLAAAAAFFMVALWPGAAVGGEAATTWRAGDAIFYDWGCHDAGSVIAIAESDHRDELHAVLTEKRKCFRLSRRIPALLEAWIAGPFGDDDGAPGSVWRLLDAAGDIEFAWVSDGGGRHAARREMAL